jgi:hypothetical protein
VPLFVGHGFSRKRDNKLHFNFYMPKGAPLIYRIMPSMSGLHGCIAGFGAIVISRCFGIRVVLRKAYNTDILHDWYQSIDVHCKMLHVEFDDGLSISVLKQGSSVQKVNDLPIH